MTLVNIIISNPGICKAKALIDCLPFHPIVRLVLVASTFEIEYA